jgi:pyrimidine-nucleoside phosphorylase
MRKKPSPSRVRPPLHMIDLIRSKRNGDALNARELGYVAAGAADGSIATDQLAAWLMAAWIRGLSLAEIRALTLAMRDSGEKFDPERLGKSAVDKHSTGGVGDKTSFLVAPLVASCGIAVPMISGRALGHTGGTLDKLEAIPGYRTALSLREFEGVIRRSGASIVGQTPSLVPADRVLYALRDRTGTVESPGLICASILSKKLAAGLDGLVLDVKTGSGAFLPKREDADYLAALMVSTAESAGTRAVALMTDMSQPLGRAAGNWIEIAECVELLRGAVPPETEDVLELSLQLAAWMIHLGGKARSVEAGYRLAQAALRDGRALASFLKMVGEQGGDIRAFDDLKGFHRPGATRVLKSWRSGFVAAMDTTMLGWAVQRLGAGREKAGEPVDPHAGVLFHAKRGTRLERGAPFATLFATHAAMLAEPEDLIRSSVQFSKTPPRPVSLIDRVFTRKSARAFLAGA